MSNPESFIEEVTEEVRRDRMSRLMRKYGWIGVLGVVLIVGGAAFNEYRKAQETAAAQAFGDGLYAALEGSSEETRLIALQEVSAPDAGAAILALISAAETASDPGEAAALLQSVLANPETPEIYADLARLRLALLGDAAAPAADRRALLDVLILGSGPFRLLALEQRALLEIEAGDTETAIATLQEVIRAAGASLQQQQRAAQLIVALGGDVDLAEG